MDAYLKLDLYDQLKSGILLCKVMNNLMMANPSFVEANLPPIEINERTDLFASLSNLSAFVRTCEMYFNVDRQRIFDPIQLLRHKDEKPFVMAVHFIRMVLEQTGMNSPVFVAKPYVALTFDQLSQFVSMITAQPSNPVVAYDPRVVMSVQDTEVFKSLASKIDAIESN